MKITADNVIKQLQRKNPAALEYLMDTYGSGVYGLVYRVLTGIGSKEDIEECVSDVYVAAWENAWQYDAQKGSLKTWLLILAKYKALDYRRRLSRDKAVICQSVHEPGTEAVEAPGNIGATGSIVEEKVISGEEQRQIATAINSLEDMDRQIFAKRYFLYENIEDIAQYFGLTRKAVDTRLWRIRNALKPLLQQEGKEGLG